jgi:hypothetical protein
MPSSRFRLPRADAGRFATRLIISVMDGAASSAPVASSESAAMFD